MIYVIFWWKKGGNKPALSANYLQDDTWLCGHPGMARGSQWGTGRQSHVVFFACSTIHGAPNDLEQGAGKQTWATCGIPWSSWKWALGRWTQQGFRAGGSWRFQSCRSPLPQAMSLTGGLGTRNFAGLSLENWRRLYLLFHKLLFPNVLIHKCC